MIINLRGTSGSGKSFIVRRVMELYASTHSSFASDLTEHLLASLDPKVERRRQPLSYLCKADGHSSLFVPGHYETPCGGCDTITKPDDVYTLIHDAAGIGHDVLFEGIMVQDDVNRAVALNKQHRMLVIRLKTPMEICLASVQKRRDERGDTRPFKTKNTIDRDKRVRRSMDRLRLQGVETKALDREEAYTTCAEALGWTVTHS